MAVVRDRMHALLLERGPLTSMQVAAALDISQSQAANAGRELVAAGRATQDGRGAPWCGVKPSVEEVPPGEPRHLSSSKVASLHERIRDLPLLQQALIIEGTPFDMARIEAMASALRPFPEAAQAVARALRELT